MNYNNKILFTIFSGLFISACGGSGSDTNNGTAPKVSIELYTGVTTQATLSENNADTFSSLIFSDFLSESISSSDGGGGQSTVDGDTLIGGCAGQAVASGELDENDFTGTITIDFENFDDCTDSEIDGKITITIEEYNSNYDEIISGIILFESARFTSSDSSLKLSGSLTININSNLTKEEYFTSSMDVVDLLNNEQYRLEDYSEKSLYAQSGFSTLEAVNYSGRVYAGNEGYIDISTTDDWVCVYHQENDCLVDIQKRAMITLSGNGGSVGLYSFAKHNQEDHESILLLDVDSEGDGVFEFSSAQPMSQLSLSSENQQPFVYAGRDITVFFDETAQVTLNSSASFDPENDPLTYKWEALNIDGYQSVCTEQRVNTGDTDNLQIGEANLSELEIFVSDYGDYCFELSIGDPQDADTPSRWNSDFVLVRFKKVELFDLSYIELDIPSRQYNGRGLFDFEVMDLNNDSKLDLMVVMNHDLKAHAYLQNDIGKFSHSGELELPLQFDRYNSISDNYVAGDIDNNGTDDLVALNLVASQTYSIDVYFQAADNTFSSSYSLDELEGTLSFVKPQLADLNHDGLLDVVLLGTNTIRVYLQNSEGFDQVIELGTENNPLPANEYMSRPAVIDLDGDGKNEIIANRFNKVELRLMEVQDNSLIEKAVYVTPNKTGSYSYTSHTVADINNDNSEELIVYNDGTVEIFDLIDGTLTATEIQLPDSFNADGIKAIDANNDGLQDLFIHSKYVRMSGVLLQQSNGAFSEMIRIPEVNNTAQFVDINQDGKIDMVDNDLEEIVLFQSK